MEQISLFSSGAEQLFYPQRVDGSIPSKDTLVRLALTLRVYRLVVGSKISILLAGVRFPMNAP